MALIRCKECGKEISNTMRKCPHCGVKLQNNTSLIVISLIIMLILVIIVGAVYYNYDKAKRLEKARETRETSRQLQYEIDELEDIKNEYTRVYNIEDSYYRTKRLQELQERIDKIK